MQIVEDSCDMRHATCDELKTTLKEKALKRILIEDVYYMYIILYDISCHDMPCHIILYDMV